MNLDFDMDIPETQDVCDDVRQPLPELHLEQIGSLGIRGRTYPVRIGPNRIGRDMHCEIFLNFPSISRLHAVISANSKTKIAIMDLHSYNKTKVGARYLDPYMKYPLNHGDIVEFGSEMGVFTTLQETEDYDDDIPLTQCCDDQYAVPEIIPETPDHSIVQRENVLVPESPEVINGGFGNIMLGFNKPVGTVYDTCFHEMETQLPLGVPPKNNNSIVEQNITDISNRPEIVVRETGAKSPILNDTPRRSSQEKSKEKAANNHITQKIPESHEHSISNTSDDVILFDDLDDPTIIIPNNSQTLIQESSNTYNDISRNNVDEAISKAVDPTIIIPNNLQPIIQKSPDKYNDMSRNNVDETTSKTVMGETNEEIEKITDCIDIFDMATQIQCDDIQEMSTQIQCDDIQEMSTQIQCDDIQKMSTQIQCDDIQEMSTQIQCDDIQEMSTQIQCDDIQEMSTQIQCDEIQKMSTQIQCDEIQEMSTQIQCDDIQEMSTQIQCHEIQEMSTQCHEMQEMSTQCDDIQEMSTQIQCDDIQKMATQIQCDDIQEMATQIQCDDIQEMATQILYMPDNNDMNKGTNANNPEIDIQDMPTQILIDNNPSKPNIHEMLTQVIVENIAPAKKVKADVHPDNLNIINTSPESSQKSNTLENILEDSITESKLDFFTFDLPSSPEISKACLRKAVTIYNLNNNNNNIMEKEKKQRNTKAHVKNDKNEPVLFVRPDNLNIINSTPKNLLSWDDPTLEISNDIPSSLEIRNGHLRKSVSKYNLKHKENRIIQKECNQKNTKESPGIKTKKKECVFVHPDNLNILSSTPEKSGTDFPTPERLDLRGFNHSSSPVTRKASLRSAVIKIDLKKKENKIIKKKSTQENTKVSSDININKKQNNKNENKSKSLNDRSKESEGRNNIKKIPKEQEENTRNQRENNTNKKQNNKNENKSKSLNDRSKESKGRSKINNVSEDDTKKKIQETKEEIKEKKIIEKKSIQENTEESSDIHINEKQNNKNENNSKSLNDRSKESKRRSNNISEDNTKKKIQETKKKIKENKITEKESTQENTEDSSDIYFNKKQNNKNENHSKNLNDRSKESKERSKSISEDNTKKKIQETKEKIKENKITEKESTQENTEDSSDIHINKKQNNKNENHSKCLNGRSKKSKERSKNISEDNTKKKIQETKEKTKENKINDVVQNRNNKRKVNVINKKTGYIDDKGNDKEKKRRYDRSETTLNNRQKKDDCSDKTTEQNSKEENTLKRKLENGLKSPDLPRRSKRHCNRRSIKLVDYREEPINLDIVTLPSRKKTNNHHDSTIYQSTSSTSCANTSTSTSPNISTNSRNSSSISSIVSPVKMIDTPHVCFTVYPGNENREKLKKLGAVLEEDIKKTTVLVTGPFKRSLKILCAMGLGIPIVDDVWITACLKAGGFVDPWSYLVKDYETERRFGFNLKRALRGNRNFLKGYNVTSTPNVYPPPETMKNIVECSGGVWREGGNRWLCLTSEDDSKLWPRYKLRGATLVRKDLLLEGALRQYMDLPTYIIPDNRIWPQTAQ